MVVNIEFLDREPIENLITCMNFKIDRVVFFGYHEVIQEEKDKIEKFLNKYCDIEEVTFHALSHDNLDSIVASMRKEIQYEKAQNNEIYFDVTGGEDLILIAFGMLANEFKAPMHKYDVAKDELIELNRQATYFISSNVEKRKVPLNLDLEIEMHGGKINRDLQKSIKDINDAEYMKDIESIYDVASQNWDCWNPFSNFLKNTMAPVDLDTFKVNKNANEIIEALKSSNTNLKSVKQLNRIVDELAARDILKDVEHIDGHYCFRFKNQAIKECLWDGGSVLEMHTCKKESSNSDECMVGVHIDWDGVIHSEPGVDVMNEIDVLSLKGNIPTFISCKSGKMAGPQILHALYELETVTRRFGGKYAKKILVTAQTPSDVYMERAQEMGIEVR